jgi:hypothetical protein
MSENNTNETIASTETNDLDTFAAELFGESTQEAGNAKPATEETDTEVQESDAETNEQLVDTQQENTEDTDTLAPDDEDDETDEQTEGQQPEGKKRNRYQERINQVLEERRLANERAERAERELQALKATKTDEGAEEAPTQATDTKPSDGPNPKDYPLGEFDPQYLKAMVEHMLTAKEREQQEAQRRAEMQAEVGQRQEVWNEKLVDARERYPDFQEKGEQMLSVFEGIDPEYGQYLTDTLMDMDAGPDVFYYLANNIEEAEQIVQAGPRKATIALGRLEAKFAKDRGSQTSNPSTKVTKAKAPPPRVKGSSVSAPIDPLNTDDLDAFAQVLFKK